MTCLHTNRILPTRNTLTTPQQQTGAVLIVSLILLLVMTLIGVSNMRSSSLQMKMAANNQVRSQAFTAAEFVLHAVEREIQSDFDQHDPDTHVQNCSGANCYNSACTGGLCFEGTPTWLDRPACKLADGSGSELNEYVWMRNSGAIWNSSTTYREMAVPNTKLTPKYIIEFMCYTHKDPDPSSGALCDVLTPNDCLPLYRITVLAEGENGNSKVMLQTTTKVNG